VRQRRDEEEMDRQPPALSTCEGQRKVQYSGQMVVIPVEMDVQKEKNS
jgi:hypothetical protein